MRACCPVPCLVSAFILPPRVPAWVVMALILILILILAKTKTQKTPNKTKV